MTEDSLLKRKSPAHRPIAENGFRSPIVFLTVCTKDRKRILDREEAHRLIVQSWEQAVRWVVGRYVIMPDHIHLFCARATSPNESLRAWMKYWKSSVSRSWPQRDEQPIWQQDGWDTQLRRGESYGAKWQYVRENPVRAGLVFTADAWPFQGELNVLTWHDS